MVFGPDERAQSTLVGFILLFGILVIAFSSYQAVVVPNQNAEVEFNHNQDVQTDMQELRNSLVDVRSVERIEEGEYEIVSEHRPARVRLGTQYPARLIALNPPNPAGSLQTDDPSSGVTIENAEVTNADAFVVESDRVEELVEDDFQAGVDTRFISYQPQYNEYRNAPETVFEHSLLYNSFQEDDLVVRDQRLINDRQLNILLFSGEVSRASGQTVTLDPETIDGPTGPINITADSGPIEITVPTKTPSVWEKEAAIGTEFGEGATHARVIDTTANQVTIELEEGETYQVRAARVAFDGGTEENEFTPIQLANQDPPGMGTGDGALPGPQVSNAQGPDPDDEPLEAGDEFELTADVSSVGQTGEDNWRGGTTIQAAEWYVEGNDPGKGNANPMEAVDGEYLNDVEVGIADEVSTDDLEEGTNTVIIRGQDSRGIWSENEDTDSITVDVGEDAEPAEFYPNSGSANTGTLEDFNNLQADDGDVASFLGDGGGGSAFDIDIVTNDVPSGDYTLEISVSDGSFQGGGVDVIVDGDTVATISETGQTTVDLTGIGGDVTVTYQGRNQNSDIDVDYQRLVEN